MHKRQFIALCICSFIPICVGTGLVPLLPIYAIQLGATPAMVGNYLSFVYLALAIGTVSAGWLSNNTLSR